VLHPAVCNYLQRHENAHTDIKIAILPQSDTRTSAMRKAGRKRRGGGEKESGGVLRSIHRTKS